MLLVVLEMNSSIEFGWLNKSRCLEVCVYIVGLVWTAAIT